MAVGLSMRYAPAFRRDLRLSYARPVEPEVLAPACPTLFSAGALVPAMKAARGLFRCVFIHSAASSSPIPPISPMSRMALVVGSFAKSSKISMKSMPFTGSPPIPTHVDCPSPNVVVCQMASYVSVPDLETIPIQPGEWIELGRMPILHAPGVIIPGQLGPIKQLQEPLRACLIVTMS